MAVHELKTWPRFFEPILSGKKRFEVRKNDRGFHEGDILFLREWDGVSEEYTGRRVEARVLYILDGGQFGIEEGFVCMSILRAN